jgi:pilus assembly protein CpaF
MSLLDKVQAKSVQAGTEAASNESVEGAQQPIAPKKDLLTTFRQIRGTDARPKEQPGQISKHQELKNKLHKQILHDLKDDDVDAILPKIDAMAIQLITEDESFRGKVDRKKVVDELIHDLSGYGPINPLLLDPEVSEVMVNGPNQVYVERGGKLELSYVQFRDDEHVMNIIEKIVSPIGRRVDESSPMVDARLPDGSRVNVIIPPLSLKGPTITIRKFSKEPFTS